MLCGAINVEVVGMRTYKKLECVVITNQWHIPEVPEVCVPCWHHYLDYLNLGLNGMVQDRLHGIHKFTL